MNPRSLLSTGGWGIFCACSWTWCIGMYLPFLMLQRFGWPGFLVFAIPNIIGCAAFGYVIRQKSQSREIVNRHGTAALLFSVATICYHMFFLGFLALNHLGLGSNAVWMALALPPLFLVAGLLLSLLPTSAWPAVAVAVFAVSIVAFVMTGAPDLTMLSGTSTSPVGHVWWVAPTIIFGFLLCPYLDLTLHRALQETPSRHAFSVFGGAFAVMILLTVVMWSGDSGALSTILLAHIGAQTVFTIGAHAREIRLSNAIACPKRRAALLLIPLIGGPLALVAIWFDNPSVAGEDLYIRFLVVYGLLAPAYVLIFIASKRPPALATRSLAVFGIVVIASLPFYELGFVHGLPWLLPVPLAALLAWRLAQRHPPPPTPGAPEERPLSQ